MPDPGPPPPPPPPQRPRPPQSITSWTGEADNPTTYPSRPIARVEAEIDRAEAQRAELEADMRRTGQNGALVVAELSLVAAARGRACTSTAWTEGRITVLPRADTIVLTALPTTIDGTIVSRRLRWGVVARVCGRACWQPVPDLDPPRWITRRWPTPAELEVLAGLAIPAS